MKTIICAINSKYIHSSLAPWYLLAGIEKYGSAQVAAEVVEATINEALRTVASRIIDKTPDVIGLCCYIWNISFIKELLPLIKKDLPQAVVVLGGPEVSYNAGNILHEVPLVNYIVSGEGELPFALLLNALADGTNITEIPGLGYRMNGEIIISAPYSAPDMPPDPFTDDYFKALGGRIAYLETSRGCPFRCAFCLSGREDRVRFFNLDRAKHDILRLAVSGAQTVKFVDRTFNAGKSRANEIWSFIIDNYGSAIPRNVCFHFEIAGDLLDDSAVDVLATAPRGLFQFEIGLQSFNPATLEAVRRKTDTTILKRNIERLISFGTIHIHIDLIAGLPCEDMKSFAESFNTAFNLKPHMLQFGFLKLLHGSAMRAEPVNYPCDFSVDPPYEVQSTPWLTAMELEQLHSVEHALDQLYNTGRFHRTLRYLLPRTGMTPFQLFMVTGAFIDREAASPISLDAFTARILEFFGKLPGVDRARLYDSMVCDRIATIAGGRLPMVLRHPDNRWKQVMTSINTNSQTRLHKGVRRCFALLASEKTAVYADYTNKDPVTGEYELHKVSLDL